MGFLPSEGEGKGTSKLLRLSADQKKQIEERAAAVGMKKNVTEYIIRCALGRRIDAKVDNQLILELIRVGKAFDRFHEDPRVTIPEEEQRQILLLLIETLERV